jgi:hypothetical protein
MIDIEVIYDKVKVVENDFPEISRLSIEKCKDAFKYISSDLFEYITFYPDDFGGIQMHCTKETGDLVCVFGDTCMSYFTVSSDGKPKFYSFQEYNDRMYEKLAKKMWLL